MKRLFPTLILLFIGLQFLFSQGPTNGNRFNFILKSNKYYFKPDDNGSADNKPTFAIKARVDGNNSPTCQLYSNGTEINSAGGDVFNLTWTSDVPQTFGATRNILIANNVGGHRADLTWVAWDDKCGNPDEYNDCCGIACLNGSDSNQSSACHLMTSRNGGTGENHFQWYYTGDRNSGIEIISTWRNTYGVGSQALTFGPIPQGQSRSHVNFNKGAAPGNTTALHGYLNSWTSAFDPNCSNSRDVTYSFEVNERSQVNISTNNPLTDFDTRISLFRKVGSEYIWINTSSDISSTNQKTFLSEIVNSGLYYIVVEGDGSGDVGKFDLTVGVSDYTIIAGQISHPAQYAQQGCSLNIPVANEVEGSSSSNSFSYSWQKKTPDESEWSIIPNATSITLSGNELGSITEDIEVRRLYSNQLISLSTNTLLFEALSPSEVGTIGRISGKITGKNGFGEIPNVLIRAIPAEPIPGACPNQSYEALSIGNGEYVIPNIYHGLGTTTWKIVPEFLDHKFDPDTFTVDLFPDVYQRLNINFQDTTTIFISGRMTQTDGQKVCGMPEVGLFLNGMNQLPLVTDIMGNYSLPIINRDPNDHYIVRPDTTNYQFTPSQSPILVVLQDTSGVNFENTRMDTISGTVLACGGFYFGRVFVTINDLEGCFKYTQLTDPNGHYEVIVPARKYEVSVERLKASTSVDPQVYTTNAILQYFGNIKDTVDITKESAVVNYQYRQKPEMVINNLPTRSCNGQIVDTVFTQGEKVELIISVYEANTNQCPLDTGVVIVSDTISGVDVEIPVSNGVAYYTVNPGEPNIFSPYTKNINFVAQDIDNPDLLSQINMNVIVEGTKARTASFTTVAPQTPILILRDPPGDQSYSFVETSETYEMATTVSALEGGGANAWREVRAGAQFEAGFLGFSTESKAWALTDQGISVAQYNTSATESVWSITHNERYETERGDELIGRDADMFVAGALNFRYALADIIEYNNETCSIDESVDLIMGADNIRTLATYSRNNIVTNIIPELEVIRDLMTDPDSIRNWNMQIDAWHQMLDLSDELAADARPDGKPNRSWDGGDGEIMDWTTRQSSDSRFIEFQVEIESSVAIEAGFEVAGAGISGGVDVFLRMETGGSKTQTELSTRTHGYVLNDDDPEDKFETEIFFDPIYSSPVFRNTSSQTTCPYEGGVLIDQPLISVDNPVAIDVDPNGKAFFNLAVTNGTELSSNSPNSVRTIYLDVVDRSNPHSAVVKPGGDQIFPLKFENMERGETINRLITIERTDPNIFTLEGIEFIVYPECDGQTNPVSSTTSVSAFFLNSCSDITMNVPDPSVPWKVNENSDNTLSVQLIDYNRALIDEVTLQYTPTGLNSWTDITTIQGSAMNSNATSSGGTSIDWNVIDVPDGEYDIRIRLNCSTGSTFTQRVSGIIDRTKPSVFGLPSPIDDDYDLSAGDEISAHFTEEIVCNAGTSAILTNMETNEEYSATLTCTIDKVSIVPDQILGNLDPAPYRVVLEGVRDKNNNVGDTYRWAFLVGDYVYDPDCSPIMIANNNINQDAIAQFAYYSEQISSNGVVGGGTNIEFNSEQSIEFMPGFEVKPDGQLTAAIKDCPND